MYAKYKKDCETSKHAESTKDMSPLESGMFSRERMLTYQQNFHYFGKNSDGTINATQLSYLMTYMGDPLTEEEIKKSKDFGCITFPQFIALMEARVKASNDNDDAGDDDPDMKAAFSTFSKGKQFIPLDDLFQIIITQDSTLTEGEIKDILQIADKDGDGMLNYKEFVRVMNAH